MDRADRIASRILDSLEREMFSFDGKRGRTASHSVYMQEYPERTSPDEIRQDIDRHMLEECDRNETGSGMRSNLVVFDRVFDDRAEAERFLAERSRRYQDCAVKVKRPNFFKSMYGTFAPMYERLWKRIREYGEKWFDRTDEICPKCGAPAQDVPVFFRNALDGYYDTDGDRFVCRPKQVFCPVRGCFGVIHDFSEDPGLKPLLEERDRLDRLWMDQKERGEKAGDYRTVWLARADRHV